VSALKLLLLALGVAGGLYGAFGPAGALAGELAPLPEPQQRTGARGAPLAHFDPASWAAACRAADVPGIVLGPEIALDPLRRLIAESRAWTQARDGDALGRMGEIASALELHESAVELFTAAAELGTQTARWTYFAGIEHQQLGRLEPAVRLLRAALALDPTIGVVRPRLGRALFDLGDHAAAKTEFEACLRSPTTAALGHVGLARLALVAQAHAEALAQLDKAAALTPNDYVIWHLRAQACAALGRSADAARDAERGFRLPRYRGWLSFDPLVREAAERARVHSWYENQFSLAQARGDLPAALRHADELTRLLPGDPETWRRAAATAWAANDANGARARLNRGLEAGPADVPLLCTAAEIEIAATDLVTALAHARKAVAADGHAARAREVLGRALYVNGQAPEAIAEVRRAVELAPEEIEPRRVLVEMLALSNRQDEARLELEALLRIAPDDAWARERLAPAPTKR
jgi:tetratricopeptide (TPR) repeat protein